MRTIKTKGQVLPLKVKNLANSMFAGSTGFSGPEITGFFAQYSDEVIDYWDMSPTPSRKIIFEECLRFFSLQKKKQLLLELCEYDGDMKHGLPEGKDIARLKRWIVAEIPSSEDVKEILRKINVRSISDDWNKAVERLNDDPEGAITSARAMIESVCKSVLEQKGTKYVDDGDIIKLYKQAAKSLNLSPEQHTEQIFKQILGGCASIVNGFAGLRNKYGDAHGKGKQHVKADVRHARLAVNMAGGLCLFLLETLDSEK